MFRYEAYGYSIDSEIELPLAPIPALKSESDITIRRGRVEEMSNGVVRRIEGLLTFSISYEGLVVVDIIDKSKTKYIASVIRGEIISAFLRWKGHLVIHASAVSVEGKAIAFMGPSGYGKSVSAMSVIDYSGKSKLITDDILPLSFDKKYIYANPSFPRARLWGAEQKKFIHNKVKVSSIHEGSKKKEIDVDHKFENKATRLDSIFFLSGYRDEGGVTIEVMEKVESLKFIMSQIWSRGIVDKNKYKIQDINNVAKLVKSVDIFKLKRTRNINKVGIMAKSVLDFRNASAV
jgi:hypothetical protein